MTRPPTRPWDAEERAWLLECFAAGDSVEEMAAWAARPVAEVEAGLAEVAPKVSARDLRLLALWGDPTRKVAEIAAELAISRERVKQLVKRLRELGFSVPRREAGAPFARGNSLAAGHGRPAVRRAA